MTYKAIILDADDTLFDFGANERKALKKLLNEFHLPVSEEALSLFHRENKAVWELFEKGHLLQSEINTERFKNFLAQYQPHHNLDVVVFSEAYINHLSGENETLDGALAFVKALSDTYPLYILTNGFKRVQEQRIGNSNLAPYFKQIFISEALGVSKPNPKVFDKVLDTIGITDPKDVLMIGDSLSSDILGANRAGMPCVWFNAKQQENHTKAIPDHTVTTFSEILKILHLNQ